MRILLVMDPGILIPVTGYGGIERLIELYALEYKNQGHEVELLITGGSKVAGCTVHDFGKPGFPPDRKDALRAIPTAWKFLNKNYKRFDLIHNFGRLAYLIPVLNKRVKKIMTYQREITARNIQIIQKLPHKNLYFTGCSANLLTRSYLPGKWKAVHNGIDFDLYECTNALPDNAPLIFLGRIDKIKGCHTAIEVAKATNHNLIIAGNISTLPEDKKYFEEEIKPLIDGEQIKYIGTVNDQQKNEWLGKSKAMLMPIEWNEPFGIVMIEAMACGTPVIGFTRGSVDEVIDEDITGFKVQDKEQMIAAIKKLPLIDRQRCRQKAEERFNVHKIAKEYLDLFAEPAPGKKVVLVTSAQPATTPRLVKEADLLAANGYDVTVLYVYKIEWAFEVEKKLLGEAKWQSILVGGSPACNRLRYLTTKLRQRLVTFLNNIGLQKIINREDVYNRCFREQLRLAKKLRADIYIGHSIGSLAVVVNAAKFVGTKAGFDYEDYHRAEYRIDDTNRSDLIKYLEHKYVPQLDYVTYSSPLIQKEILLDFPELRGKGSLILNCFPMVTNKVKERPKRDILSLFWFSQTVGPDRGLECLFAALIKLNNPNICLTLAGRIREDIKEKYFTIAEKIAGVVNFPGIIEPDLLTDLAAQHDVGLALEPGFSRNNSLALSNKIFTYLLAGNAIIFSETEAQKEFNDSTRAGLSFKPDDVDGLAECINAYTDKTILSAQRKHNLDLASSTYNWENESKKLLALLTEILK